MFGPYLKLIQCGPYLKLIQCGPPASQGDLKDAGSIPGSGRSPGVGNGKPLQYPCLENPTDRGAWQAPWSLRHLKTLGMTEGLHFT